MSTHAAEFEQLPANTRQNIRKSIINAIRTDPRPNATYNERLDRAVNVFARKYGVKRDTIRRIFGQHAAVAPDPIQCVGGGGAGGAGSSPIQYVSLSDGGLHYAGLISHPVTVAQGLADIAAQAARDLAPQ